MNLAGTTFKAISNSTNGSLDTETTMHFTSDDRFVVGHYSGGSIVAGHVIGTHTATQQVEMLYQGATVDEQIQAGKAVARFEGNPQEATRMYLDWQWLTGDQSKGQSVWELVE